ncbi:MAG: 30S ribosomal protein S20 [Candidatus Puniceispirillales bacterium]
MANHKSAKKRIRRNETFNAVNSNRRSRIRTYIKKVEAAIENGNVDEAREAFKLAQPELHRGVNRGVFHKNTAARKLSRLSARIKALAA